MENIKIGDVVYNKKHKWTIVVDKYYLLFLNKDDSKIR